MKQKKNLHDDPNTSELRQDEAPPHLRKGLAKVSPMRIEGGSPSSGSCSKAVGMLTFGSRDGETNDEMDGAGRC